MYKNNIKLILFIFSIGFPPMVFAQDLGKLQEHIKTVETGKLIYRQTIKSIDEGLVQFSVTEIDVKGKENEIVYNFNFADIDKNTVRALTKKDVITVQLLASGKQKLIKATSDGGDKVTYLNELQFYAADSENGNELEKNTKALIPEATDLEKKRLSLSGYEEHLKWLLENINDVELSKSEIIQKTSAPKELVGKFILDRTINAKSKTKNELRELNLSTLNPNSVAYRISGEEFLIKVTTRRNIKGIRYFEDGEQKNYMDELVLYAKSVTNGKDIFRVLKAIIPLAETAFEAKKPNISSSENALKYLNSVIADVSTNEETLSQNLSTTSGITHFKLTETKPNESTEFEYQFNFADINANNIDYQGQKDRLFVTLPTKKSVKFIQTKKNGALENYGHGTTIFFNSIEDAIVGTSALKALAENFEKKLEDRQYNYTSLNQAISDLKEQMVKVKIDEDNYDTFIELLDTNTLKLTTVFSNLKKSQEVIQEFMLKDLNDKNINITVSGKHVGVELNTNHLEKIVKTYVDGEIKPYRSKIGIEVPSIENARQIAGIFTVLAKKSKS